MSDYSELCVRLRQPVKLNGREFTSPVDCEAASALESQAREIAELTERVTTLEAAVIAPVDGESVLGKLGSKLADLLDENDWASVEPYLNRALLENYGLRTRAEAAEKEAKRWRVVRDRMRHMRCGPNVGWGLDELYPGDDPDSAIDAVAAPEGKT